MAKKSFSKGIDAFFGESSEKKQSKKTNSAVKEAFEENGQGVDKRATFLIEVDQLEKLKALAYWERKTSKLVLKQSLELLFSSKGDEYIEEALENYRKNHSSKVEC